MTSPTHGRTEAKQRRGPTFTYLALAVLVWSLTACAFGAPAPATVEPKGGNGDFRVLLTAEPTTLNPDLKLDDSAFNVCQNIFNKLVTLDADYRVIPDLAQSWEIGTDAITYTFHLVKNVRWHDGQPFTSADVKWTFEAIIGQKGYAQDLSRVSSIETPDANTVVFTLKESWAPFLPTLAWYGTFILPKHLYDGSDWNANPANQSPVGTGPFKFTEWVKGERISLAANLDYFRRGPFLDGVTFLVLKDTSVALDLLLKGDIDYSLARPAFQRLPELQQDSNIQVRTFPHPARYYVGFNLRRAPFDDLRVRTAINKAIDRGGLVDKALSGYGAPGLGFYTPAVAWAFNPQATVPAFDAAGAETLLEQAGLPRKADGSRLEATLVTSDLSPFKDMAAVIRDQLGPLGVKVTVVLLSAPDFTKRVVEGHDFDMALANGTQGPDPNVMSVRFGSQGGYQFMGYGNPDFDAAVEEGARKAALKERAQAYFRAQEILARDLPIAPLAEYVQLIASRASVSGLPQTEARGLVTFNDYSLVRMKR